MVLAVAIRNVQVATPVSWACVGAGLANSHLDGEGRRTPMVAMP